MANWTRNEIWKLILALLLGQLISIAFAVTSLCSTLLPNLGVDIPLTQSFLSYLSLALVYTPIFLYRRKKLQVHWYWYVLLAFVDVQGNFLVIKACQFTSITSVSLLNGWTILWVFILTWIFIGTRYSLWQFFAAALCVIGLCFVILSDRMAGDSGGDNPLLGDLLVIGGTLCYAMSNVGEEFCVKKRDLVEVVSMLGVFGVLVSICEISIVEWEDLKAVKWSTEIILLLVLFALTSFGISSMVPFVLKMSGAALFNLSVLTTNMWVVAIRIFFYHQKVDWLSYLSFAVEVLGLVIYCLTDKNHASSTHIANEDDNINYEVLNEEDGVSRNESE